MLTPAMMASRVSAFCFVIISYARATPRIPFAEAITSGGPEDPAPADWPPAVSRISARASGLSANPAAAAAPAPTNRRLEIDTLTSDGLIGPFSADDVRSAKRLAIEAVSAQQVGSAFSPSPLLTVWRSGSFPLRMKSSPPTRIRRLRLEAAEGPRIDLSGPTRREHDLLGEREVPEGALYGIQTLRAIENFCISGIELHEFPTLVAGLATVKEAAALANLEMNLIDREIVDAIAQAASEIREGMHHDHFRVDMIQGGAGTSSNMNANEVMANRALEILGKQRGEYDFVHPNNHLNLSQSTNDVYPTAVKLALHTSISDLQLAMIALAAAFLHKGEEFASYIKMGRTQLQDAVPMTLGQEFNAFAHTMLEDVDRLGEAQALIREINMGATAIGTGITAPPGYAESVRRHLEHITGLALITAPDLVEATADTGAFVQLSGVIKRCAVKLSKICNDLRLLSSGPRAGFGEINLPAMQPGSSIMPGKVNPVIPEMVNQVCFDIIGGDMTVTMAAEAGQLQLNVFEPIIAFRLLSGMTYLTRACKVLQNRCVEGITANRERMASFVEQSVGLITALVPVLGYETTTEIAKEALETGRSVYDLVCERGIITREQLDRLLNPSAMTAPRHTE